MDMSKFNKIVVVSLCDSYTKAVGEKLSQNLGMMFCDTKDLIEYELIDKKALEELCSKAYLQKAEKMVLQHIASFENVVVGINFDYLIHNFDLLNGNSLFVFLKLSKTFVKGNGNVVDLISYENRTTQLEKLATVTINIRKTDTNFVCEKVVEELGGLL
jgi:hypothetical protein